MSSPTAKPDLPLSKGEIRPLPILKAHINYGLVPVEDNFHTMSVPVGLPVYLNEREIEVIERMGYIFHKDINE